MGQLEKRIEALIANPIEHLGYEVVRIKMLEGIKRKTLQIMIDRADEAAIQVEDCEAASRQISALLDVEDPITENYDLEVSSPGVDRPLTRPKDFERFKGLEVKIETQDKIEDRRRFKGELLGLEEENVLVSVRVDGQSENECVAIALDNILNAKLVLTDELLAMHESN
jgi:ribosome maturation factor RimP